MKQLLFSFQGRIGRASYWWTTLGLTVALFVVALFAMVLVALFGASPQTQSLTPGGGIFLVLLYLVVFVVATWVSLAIGVKRWHDLGRSGWFMLLFYIPVLGFVAWCYMAFMPGNEAENEYGVPGARISQA